MRGSHWNRAFGDSIVVWNASRVSESTGTARLVVAAAVAAVAAPLSCSALQYRTPKAYSLKGGGGQFPPSQTQSYEPHKLHLPPHRTCDIEWAT
jgi:hypothetical protein